MKFPEHIFPKNLQKIIVETADLNFPTSYISASLFLAIAVAIGNSRILTVRDGWKVKPIMYMALLGRPGAVKTHPINFALAPLKKHDVKSLAKYAEELEEYRKLTILEKTSKPKAVQIIVKDATLEALAKVMSINKHGICVHFDELNGWFESFNKYKKTGGEEEQWLSLHGGDSIVINRKTQDDVISVAEPFVCVIGAMQPNVLIRCFKGHKTDNGFLNRMLFVDNSSDGLPVLWKDDDLPSTVAGDWEDFLLRVYYSSMEIEGTVGVREYTFNEDAWLVMRTWQNSKEEDLAEKADDLEISIFRKIQDYALRFCIPIQVMREVAGEVAESSKIDGITAARAIGLAEYFFENALEIDEMIRFSGLEDLSKIVQVLEMLPLRFSRAQAVAVGENLGLSRSTIFRHITGDADDVFVTRVSRGVFEKKL